MSVEYTILVESADGVSSEVVTVAAALEPEDVYVNVAQATETVTVTVSENVTYAGTSLGTAFLVTAENLDEEDETFFYWGWTSVSGGWLIRRSDRLVPAPEDATATLNSSYSDLASAWPDRASFVFS